ncbi:PREDICTED: uncharacterized protein LOC105459369 [Wasmannia auropunctata]|uniref:uncharacterized protein LOC105459369 n=1 Tax=Wasmannia auropunctata TaxID=64793 RepID=UPI0005F08FA4|nr:PREDICTED: uncharacterized protein LOC105459369 [Wasmannia auropunctata]
MLWRLFAVLAVLGGFIAICSCEPVNRKHLLKASRTIECAGNEGDISMCRTNESADTPSSNSENQTRSSRKVEQKLVDDVNDVGEVSARKRNKKGGGRIIFYMIAALKAALVYGLLHGVAALAGKAILLAKIALAIAIAAIVKKNDSEKVSYEVVKHPHHSYIQTHSSSVDYDHRSDYSDDRNDYRPDYRNDYFYEHRKRRQLIF